MTCYNDDVWMEILLWVPPKALIRFQSVCRKWLHLISSDEFRRLHTLRRHKPPPSLILHRRHSRFFHYFRPFSDTSKFVPFTLPHPKLVSSCNGLLLLQSRRPIRNRCFVYNPITKQLRKINLLKSHDHGNVVFGLNLAFDPSISPHYNIVCVRAARQPRQPVPCRVELYDSESSQWACLESFIATQHTRFYRFLYRSFERLVNLRTQPISYMDETHSFGETLALV